MAKRFYAIKIGFDTKENKIVKNLILTSWSETTQYVQGVSKKKHGITPDYKGFDTKEEAMAFLKEDAPYLLKSDSNYPLDCLHCYVDGSFDEKANNYAYGLVCVLNEQLIHCDKGVGTNEEATSMRQIGGELLGAMRALLYAKKNQHKKVVLFFDYKGVCLHATGYWKRDNVFSQTYYDWMQVFFRNNSDMEIIFCKVDSHTGDDWNEIADGLAKIALEIQPNKVFYDICDKHRIEPTMFNA